MGMGAGMRWGRGLRISEKDRKEMLKEEAEDLKEDLEAVQKELESMEKQG